MSLGSSKRDEIIKAKLDEFIGQVSSVDEDVDDDGFSERVQDEFVVFRRESLLEDLEERELKGLSCSFTYRWVRGKGTKKVREENGEEEERE